MIWKVWRQEIIPVAGIVLVLVGFVLGRVLILGMGLFLWGLAYLSSLMARQSVEHVFVSAGTADPHAEIGETVATEMLVVNPLPWPITDAQWKIDLPRAVNPSGPGITLLVPGGTRQTLTGRLFVGSRQRIHIQYQLTGTQRGRWNIGPGSLTFHDPLSWNELVRQDDHLSYLTVWPRRYPMPERFWSQRSSLGTARGQPWDPPDPLRVVGVRPYQPGDPVRQVAPYASARLARLMVKQLEPMTERTVEILIHPKTSDAHWHGIDRALLEDLISVAASVAEASVRAQFITGLSGTGALPGHRRGFRLAAARRHDAAELLTALAWLQPSGTMDDDLPFVLRGLRSHLSSSSTLVVVSHDWSPTMSEHLAGPARRGARIILLTCGDEPPSPPHWVSARWQFAEGLWSYA